MSNPSTVWTALSLPTSPVGSIPFVDTDGVTIITDVANFFYNDTGSTLNNTFNNQLKAIGGLAVKFTDSTSAPVNPAFHLTVAGRAKFVGTQVSQTISNPRCLATSLVLVVLERNDPTIGMSVIPANGSFTVYTTSNAGVTFSYFILNLVSS